MYTLIERLESHFHYGVASTEGQKETLSDVRELIELLKDCEFDSLEYCPICFGFDDSSTGHGSTRHVHTKDCRLSAILRKVGGE